MNVQTMNPFQLPRLREIEAGRKFWGYLDTEALRTRYVLAAHFVRSATHIVEIGGYRDNVITNFLTGSHESVTVYSLDAEFEPLEHDTLNRAPCRVRHVRDFFQTHEHPTDHFAVVALGLEIHGEVDAFHELVGRADRAVLEIPPAHQPSVECLSRLRAHVDMRLMCQVNLDLSPNEAMLREQLRETNMNTPFWKRDLYVFDIVK
jgi:hypothetical protein